MKNEIKQPQNSHKWMYLLPFFFLLLFLIGWFSYSLVFKNWNEIMFAIKKPNIVKIIRLQYDQKQKDLESSFLKTELTPEQKLLNAVADEIKK